MARMGILGLPNTGKTTLFNALTGLNAVTAPYPFSTTGQNVGTAMIPDPLLDQVAALEGSSKTVHASLELFDSPSAQRGASIDTELLGRMREVESLCFVLRAFDDDSIPETDSGHDPVHQAEELLLELAMSDASVFERRKGRITKEATADPSKAREADAVSKAADLLSGGSPLRSITWSDADRLFFRDMMPLTLKPAVWVVNTPETESESKHLVEVVKAVVPEDDEVVALVGKLEEEASRLDPADRAEMFEGLGLGQGALATIVGAVYGAQGLISFYTVGPKESHAWTIRRGATAREAAGKIHSDLERGFIRAEVAQLEEISEAGGWDSAKAEGLTRVEGKGYVVEAGDVLLIRFSV